MRALELEWLSSSRLFSSHRPAASRPVSHGFLRARESLKSLNPRIVAAALRLLCERENESATTPHLVALCSSVRPLVL